MGLQKVLVTYDSKIEAYSRPFVVAATGEGMRGFADAVNDKSGQSVVSQHPEDFTLFEIGTFDDQKGWLEMYDAKRSLANGLDLVRSDRAVKSA